MPYRVILSALLRAICAASLVLPTQVLAAEPAAGDDDAPTQPPKDPPTQPPTQPSEVTGASQDDLHDAMVRAFTERFQEGKFLYYRGLYTQAAAEFERAFAAIPAEAALGNVVISYERAGDRVSAALAARRYLALPSCATPDIDPALCAVQYDKIEKQLERLMEQIGEVRLEVAAAVGLREVTINGRKVALEDFPVLVAAGRIDVELVGALPGQRRQRVIDVRPGEKQTIIVGPFDEPERDPTRTVGPRGPRARPKWLKPFFWSSLGITIGSAAAMTTMGVLTLREDRLYYKERCDEVCVNPEGEDLYPHDRERRRGQYRIATNALVGVTAGLAMITVVVGLFAFTGDGSPRKRNAGTQRASTRVRWTGSGVLVRW